MGFYREVSAPPRARNGRAPSHTKVRVAAGDSLGDIYSLIAKRYPTATTVKPAAPPIKGSFTLPLISTPTPTPTAPINTSTPSRLTPTASSPSPVPTSSPTAPVTTTTRTFSPVSTTPTPTPTPSDGGGFIPQPTSTPNGGGSVTGGGYVPPTTVDSPVTIRFDSTPVLSPVTMPDAGPELYNEDGTPANDAATAASTPTLADKLKNLPTAAKIGGAVLAYLLLHGV